MCYLTERIGWFAGNIQGERVAVTSQLNKLKSEWDDRARRMGASKRAVLFKRLPGFVNESIHRRHVNFILNNMPTNALRLLDVGCGYGRLSREIKNVRPKMEIQGVELSTEFAKVYEQEIGSCFRGSILEYFANQPFDTILVITLLMYLNPIEQSEILTRLWSFLNPNGLIICIEPAAEIIRLWRRITGRASANPTGGSVNTYTYPELWSLFSNLKGVELQDQMSIRLAPGVNATTLHHGIAVKKLKKTV